MSRRIMMAHVMILLPLLFSIFQVRSDQSMIPLKSFTISGNVTYDCIDIYKQPGLVHPLLKNHTIQMKPSVLGHELNDQTHNNKTFRDDIKCSYGTVPILRNTKEFNTNAQLYAEKYVHQLSGDNPGTHIAGVKLQRNGPFRGIAANFKAYSVNIEGDQASYSQIYLGSGYYGELNYISAGMMINPGFFRDGRLWTFGFWMGKDAKGCYNTACPGFVQVSNVVPITKPIDLNPGVPTWLHWSLYEDKQTGNWWITQISPKKENIGYWPKELFHLIPNGADMVGAGGLVQASSSGLSPPMDNGNFPSHDRRKSAQFTNVDILNSNYEKHKIVDFRVRELLDSSKCYGLRIGDSVKFWTTPLGYFFNYGGPGGISCGI